MGALRSGMAVLMSYAQAKRAQRAGISCSAAWRPTGNFIEQGTYLPSSETAFVGPNHNSPLTLWSAPLHALRSLQHQTDRHEWRRPKLAVHYNLAQIEEQYRKRVSREVNHRCGQSLDGVVHTSTQLYTQLIELDHGI